MTIIQVERLTGVPSRKLRFWCDKGLFPYVQKDKNGVRYFSQKDLEWVGWIECYRNIGMSIEKLKRYIYLCSLGQSSLEKRLSIIKEERQKTLKEIKKFKEALNKLDCKINYYNKLIEQNKDSANPQSKDYEKLELLREKICHKK